MGMAMDSVTVAKIIREFFSKDKKKMINEISTLHFQFLTKFWFVFFLCHIETYKRLIIGWMWFLLAFCVYFVWYILNHSRHDLEGSANKKKVLVVALDRKKWAKSSGFAWHQAKVPRNFLLLSFYITEDLLSLTSSKTWSFDPMLGELAAFSSPYPAACT